MKLTLILGVHRSGTSLLTQGLVAAGAALGDFRDVSDPDNPDGYAEHPAVLAFNDRLLAHLGVSWDNWGFQAGTVDWDDPVLDVWRDEAVALLRAAFPGDGPFVLKDPRCATLAPFWQRVVPQAGFALRRIIILRDPAEVAESQRQRVARRPHEFPVIADAEPMAALWAVTMAGVLVALTDDETLVVSHAALLSDPVPTLTAAAAFAGLPPDPDPVHRFAAERVRPELYRARVTRDTVAQGPWMTAASALHSDLMVAGTPRLLPRDEAARIAAMQTSITALLPGLTAVRHSISRLQEVATMRQDRIAALNRLIWVLAPLAAKAPEPLMADAIAKLLALAEESDLSVTSFAFAHTVARLMLTSRRKAETEAWLARVCPTFGHIPALQQIVQNVGEL